MLYSLRASNTSTLPTGKLIAFEGIDRAGKTSLVEALVQRLADLPIPVMVCGELRSPLAPIIRECLHKGVSAFIKTYLFATDRAWTYEHMCVPALSRGELVLWDRYVDTALVYRKVELATSGSDISLDFVKRINEPFVQADLTVYLDISVATSISRSIASGDRGVYSQEFLQAVRHEYLRMYKTSKRARTIDAERPYSEVTSEVSAVIRAWLEEIIDVDNHR